VAWKEGRNVTVKVVKRKNKKKKGALTREVEKESFFNLFKEVDLSEEPAEGAEAKADADAHRLEEHYEACSAIYEELLPRSL
jgi:nucleosome assembly protein 1-like 1